MWWFLTQPHFARTAALCAEYALETGAEVRTPLLDARVIALAASRPPHERRRLGQTKLLLRTAMRGLLPEATLAPRPFKTGTLATYFSQSLTSLAPVMREAFSNPVLETLGIGRASALSRVTERLVAGRGTWNTAEQLLAALQCELWLKDRLGSADAAMCEKQVASPERVSISVASPLYASAPAALASGTSRQLSKGGL
jgi:hypothetical protein